VTLLSAIAAPERSQTAPQAPAPPSKQFTALANTCRAHTSSRTVQRLALLLLSWPQLVKRQIPAKFECATVEFDTAANEARCVELTAVAPAHCRPRQHTHTFDMLQPTFVVTCQQHSPQIGSEVFVNTTILFNQAASSRGVSPGASAIEWARRSCRGLPGGTMPERATSGARSQALVQCVRGARGAACAAGSRPCACVAPVRGAAAT
jgi:hypothetical protein